MKRYIGYLPVAIAAILWLKGFFIRDGGVGVINGLVVFLIVWWLFFFMMLPIGVRSQEEAGDVVSGSEPGAPQAPNLARKMWWTTIVTSIAWILYFAITESGVMAQFMPTRFY
ncbi:hypothetical protein AWH62_08830 [Maricaulis sp. W15]|uniref:Putative secreted protein n=1 Tax=Maricaulis maris TaxID=74318 RepID=A0A495DL05_9PROT|nr:MULTISPECIES: DUF1467 family protein [Maricaulis]OLF73045.1 hypothetical protein AWH62_08830 [Maricaulis sp. W15]RKR02987.1 putative secreted protein [Maricaulis maris]